MAIRNKLAEQANQYSTLNYSMADKAVNVSHEGTYNLEALGLDSAIRMSVVKGIELFTNFDELEDLMDFEEDEE